MLIATNQNTNLHRHLKRVVSVTYPNTYSYTRTSETSDISNLPPKKVLYRRTSEASHICLLIKHVVNSSIKLGTGLLSKTSVNKQCTKTRDLKSSDYALVCEDVDMNAC